MIRFRLVVEARSRAQGRKRLNQCGAAVIVDSPTFNMEFFSKLGPELRTARINQIDNRWKQLNGLEKESASEGMKYLLLANSGGAVATLSFIGAIGKDHISVLAKLSLAYFVLGVAFVGVSKAIEFHHMSWLYREWQHGVNRFFNDGVSWEELSSGDDKRATIRLLHLTFPYASFACLSGWE